MSTHSHTVQAPAEEPRTITYPLRTGASITSTCPPWCTTDHTQDAAAGINPSNLLHQGDKIGLEYEADGIEVNILGARIAQWPFDQDDPKPYIEYVPEGRTAASLYLSNPLQVSEEIRKVRGHLRALEELGGQLAQAQAADHTRRTRDGEAPWATLDRTDLLSMPIAYLLRVFGVTVQETDETSDSVVLGGQPGGMLLQVHPALPQHIREDQTRTALLSWFESEATTRQPLHDEAAVDDDEPLDAGKLAALANDPDRLTASDAWDAIEALFSASESAEMTRQALHEFVDMAAAKAVGR